MSEHSTLNRMSEHSTLNRMSEHKLHNRFAKWSISGRWFELAGSPEMTIILFLGVGLMGVGFLLRGRQAHIPMAAGMAVFGGFWVMQVPHYLEIDDMFNAVFCGLALPFYLFLAIQCLMSWKWKEDLRTLRWMAGTSALAGGIYFGILQSDVLSEGLIRLVTDMSTGILDLLGYEVHAGATRWTALEGPKVPVVPSGVESISIVMACTGIQAMVMFGGAVMCTRTDRSQWIKWAKKDLRMVRKTGEKNGWSPRLKWRARSRERIISMSDRERKIRAFMYTVPVIFVANLFRNAGVIWVVYTGRMSFPMAHHVIAKVLALLLMLFMALLIFDLLPELYENVLGLFDLRRRTRPGMVKDGFILLDDGADSGSGGAERDAGGGVEADAGDRGAT